MPSPTGMPSQAPGPLPTNAPFQPPFVNIWVSDIHSYGCRIDVQTDRPVRKYLELMKEADVLAGVPSPTPSFYSVTETPPLDYGWFLVLSQKPSTTLRYRVMVIDDQGTVYTSGYGQFTTSAQ